MWRYRDTKEMFLLYSLQNISAPTGHHQMIVEEYTNGDGIDIHYNPSKKYLSVKILWDPT
jgi:hypothetical protein